MLGLAHLREAPRDLVRERDRKRHQLLGLATRVAEHHPLVARPDPVQRVILVARDLRLARVVYALRDVGRLPVERHRDAARVGVEAVLGVRVADLGDLAADEPRDVEDGGRRYLAADDDEPRGEEGLAGDPPGRVLSEDRVEHGV
jgi:hypothetical protein